MAKRKLKILTTQAIDNILLTGFALLKLRESDAGTSSGI